MDLVEVVAAANVIEQAVLVQVNWIGRLWHTAHRPYTSNPARCVSSAGRWTPVNMKGINEPFIAGYYCFTLFKNHLQNMQQVCN